MDPKEPTPEVASEVIVCRVTPWYFRRMGITLVFLLGFGLYFFYDGKYGYPKDNEAAHAKEWFENTYLKSFEDAKAANRLDEWIAKAKSQGMPAGENGEPPKWATFAAQKGWAEETKHYSEADIAQQFEWGWALILGDVIVAILVLLNKNKTFVGYPDHMIMPNGREVRYADVFKVDKRKWDNKGLAYIYDRRNGQEGRVTVDDLKYEGAHRVLSRLLASFTGN